MTIQDERYAWCESMRQIIDFYEAHPEIPVSGETDYTNTRVDSKEDAQNVVRALGACEKRYSDDYLYVTKQVGVLLHRFMFTRSRVCRRVVTGVQTIPAKFVPEHIEPSRDIETVEWQCDPILSESVEETA